MLAQTHKATHKFLQANELYQQAVLTLRTETGNIFNNIHTLIKKIKFDKQVIVTANQTLNLAKNSFNVGVGDIVDVLNARQKLAKARVRYKIDIYDYILLKTDLYELAGQSPPDLLNKINGFFIKSIGKEK